MSIYRLTPSDAAGYRALMLKAYEANPEAFTSNVSERAALPQSWWEARLSERADSREIVLGALEGDRLVGVAGLRREARDKVSHKATLFGMYVSPSFRGRGVGNELVRAVLKYARSQAGLTVVKLTVSDSNLSARHLYERNGFVSFGLEPYAVCLGKNYVSKVHMWCHLEAHPANDTVRD